MSVPTTDDDLSPFGHLFCCDGFGNGDLHDPWCESQGDGRAWRQRFHLGTLAADARLCDNRDCCNPDEDSDL